MVGLEAFDLRETEVDITPWLGILCDGKEHTISMEVFGVNDTSREQPQFVRVGSNWVLSGKIFSWLNPDVSAPSRAPQVSINPMDYTSDVTELSATALDYKQSISRQITVRSNSQSYHDGTPQVEWSQAYSMSNDGLIRRSGYYQQANSSYMGRGISKCGPELRLGTDFRYPINTTYNYETPDGQGGFTLEATLSQELELAVSLGSPFATGVEPFMDRLPSEVMGSMLHARRNGHAYFSQGQDGPSIGAGQTSQHYKLTALCSGITGANAECDIGPILYERSTTVARETTIDDEEIVWGGTTVIGVPRKLERDMLAGEASEFAPIPLNQVGGVNIFMKDTDQHLGGVDSTSKAPWKDLVDQQAGPPPHEPCLTVPRRLIADW